jgi:GNAT superfamily N-acetyltransferase
VPSNDHVGCSAEEQETEMRWELHQVADMTADEVSALRALSLAVYPPEVMAAWPGLAIEWEPAAWRIIGWDGNEALCHIGVFLRDAKWNDRDVRVGGIGGVKTHPAARGRGFASTAIRLAFDFFRKHNADFALLVCEPKLIAFYERLGWQTLPGKLLVMQRGATVPFTFNLCMTAPLQLAEPLTGVIDLLGPPW